MKEIPVESGSYYIFDRAYNFFAQLYRFHCAGAFFVVRAKKNLQMSVYNTLQVLGISLTDTTPLEDLFNKSNLNIDKELDGFYEPTLFDF